MIFLKWLEGVFGFGQTDTAKSSDAVSAEGSTEAAGRTTPEYVQNVVQTHISSEERSTMMTVTKAKQKLVDWCKSQIGYHEGYDGSNKYADGQWDVKLYGFSAGTVPWCDVFVDAAYIACFGYEDATAMTYQRPSGFAACSLSADAYKRNGAFYREPEVGDQIFFFYGGAINHTGIVVEVHGDTIVCVEGNYSDMVCRTQYKWREKMQSNVDGNIAGFGRPNWSVVAEPESTASDDTNDGINDTIESEEFDIVHPTFRRTYLHLEYGDGIGMPIAQVRAWQALLQCWGYVLDADGEFGLDTDNATRQWQKYVKDRGGDVEVNGVVDEDDWIEIINVPG